MERRELAKPMPRPKNRYSRILEAIFARHYRTGLTEIPFERSEIIDVAAQLGVELPKNLGDLLYSFRYRAALPESISQTAPQGQQWLIRSVGRGQYKLALVPEVLIARQRSCGDQDPRCHARHH